MYTKNKSWPQHIHSGTSNNITEYSWSELIKTNFPADKKISKKVYGIYNLNLAQPSNNRC